ncbi:MAG: hypothetical protein ACE5QW_08075 [Thermoplasmata archaeon]
MAARLIDELTGAGIERTLFLVDRIQLAIRVHETFRRTISHRSSYIIRLRKPREAEMTGRATLRELPPIYG